MKQKWVKFLGVGASVLTIIWITGLFMTFQFYFSKNKGAEEMVKQPVELIDQDDQQSDPNQRKEKNGFYIVALGDSLTVGTGDLEGKGYIGHLVEELSETVPEPISLDNFAINGLTSDRLVDVVKDDQVQKSLKNADLIFMTIGGNDLFKGGQTLLNVNVEEIAQIERQFLTNLTTILTEIRGLNEEAPIYFSGLYHPFTHLANAEITTKVILDWNHHTALQLSQYPQTIFVPMYDLFQLQLDQFLAIDRFHPSKEGYQQMAKRIISLIKWEGKSNE